MKKLAIAAAAFFLVFMALTWMASRSEEMTAPESQTEEEITGMAEETSLEAFSVKISTDTDMTTVEIPESWKDTQTFIVGDMDGYVTVFLEDGISLYEETGIRLDELPEQEQQEVRDGFTVNSIEELYSMLETYSS